MQLASSFHESYTFLDRRQWRAGPWDREKDFYRWTDFLTKLQCVVVRTNMGVLTGNVLFPELAPMSEPTMFIHGQVPRVAKVMGQRSWSFHCATVLDGIPAIEGSNATAYKCLDYVTDTTNTMALVLAEGLVDQLRKELPRGWFGTFPYPYSGINSPELPHRN